MRIAEYLTDSFYLYHSFSVIVAQPLSFTLALSSTSDYTQKVEMLVSE